MNKEEIKKLSLLLIDKIKHNEPLSCTAYEDIKLLKKLIEQL